MLAMIVHGHGLAMRGCLMPSQYADRFTERAMVKTASLSDNAVSAEGGSDNSPASRVGDVGKILDWWAARATETDSECHLLELEKRRYYTAIFTVLGTNS